MLFAVICVVLVASIPKIEASNAVELRSYPKYLILPKLSQVNMQIKEDCSAADFEIFVGCMEKFVGVFGLNMTNGKLPYDEFIEATRQKDEAVVCSAYKELEKCPVFVKCFERSVFEKITDYSDTFLEDFSFRRYNCLYLLRQLTCFNKTFEAATKCSDFTSIVKCRVENNLKDFGKGFAQRLCFRTTEGLRFNQRIDAECYYQLMYVCSKAPKVSSKAPIVINLKIAMSLVLFMIIVIVS